MASTPIVFVHGLFMTPLCWENWLPWFAERGYRAVAPAWPGCDRPPAELRAAHPDPALARLTLADVIVRVETEVQALGGRTVVVGHGIGGVVAQILVNRGVVSAGVAIHSASLGGDFPAKRPVRPLAPGLFGRGADPSAPKALNFEEFRSVFGNVLSPEAQRAAFDRYVVPGSRRVAGDVRGAAAEIDFAKAHPPLLMTAGVRDQAVTARVAFDDFSRYRQHGAITDFRAFDERGHMVVVEPGWEEVADFVADWLSRLKP